jgi:hypothetical protein
VPVASLLIIFLLIQVPLSWQEIIDGVFLQYYVRIFNIFVWGIMNYCKPKYAPMAIILTQFTYCMFWYATFETFADEPISRDMEVKILQLIILLTGINYNSFKTNVLLLSPAILVPYWLVLWKDAQYHDTEIHIVVIRGITIATVVVIL